MWAQHLISNNFPFNNNEPAGNLANKSGITTSLVEQLSTVIVDNLRSTFQSNWHLANSLESASIVCGEGTYINLDNSRKE